jgi:hypothetical protein
MYRLPSWIRPLQRNMPCKLSVWDLCFASRQPNLYWYVYIFFAPNILPRSYSILSQLALHHVIAVWAPPISASHAPPANSHPPANALPPAPPTRSPPAANASSVTRTVRHAPAHLSISARPVQRDYRSLQAGAVSQRVPRASSLTQPQMHARRVIRRARAARALGRATALRARARPPSCVPVHVCRRTAPTRRM